jgi:hypothetical protein
MGAAVEETNLVFPLKQLVLLKLNHCRDVLPFLESWRASCLPFVLPNNISDSC